MTLVVFAVLVEAFTLPPCHVPPAAAVIRGTRTIRTSAAPSMNIFKQIFDDLKAANAAQQADVPQVEPMPADIPRRPWMRASHILLPDEEAADKLQARIDAGELTFADAARQYSLCKSKSEGGDLGTFKSLARILFLPYESQWGAVAPFDELVFAPSAEIGAIQRCSTPWGSHLVTVTARNVQV